MAVSLTRGNWMNFPAIAWNGELARRIGFSPGYDVVQDLALALDVCEQGGSHIMNTRAPKYVDTLLDPECFNEHDEVSVEELKEACAARIERLKREKQAQVQAARGTHGGVNRRRR